MAANRWLVGCLILCLVLGQSVQQTVILTTRDWAEFTMGIGLGATIEISANTANQCLSTISTLLQSGYLIGYYLSDYLVTQSDTDAAYATTYVIKLIQSGYDLSYCQTYISSILPFTSSPTLTPSLGQSYADIIAILSEYIYLIGGLENAIGILEMAIDSQSIYNEWLAQDYFTAGLFTG